MSRGLKILARELNVPGASRSPALARLEQRTDKRPQLSDLRECVTGDTLVVLADGRHVPIASSSARRRRSWRSPDGPLITARSDKVWLVGRSRYSTSGSRAGRTLRAPPSTASYGADGGSVSRARGAATGSRSRAQLPEPATTMRGRTTVVLLGQLIGDGSYLTGQPLRYTTASEDNAARSPGRPSASSARGEALRGPRKLAPARDQRQRQPLARPPASTTGCASWASSTSAPTRSACRRRSSGSATSRSRCSCVICGRPTAASGPAAAAQRARLRRVYFSTASEGLARDVSALLLRLGIVGAHAQIARASAAAGAPRRRLGRRPRNVASST